MAQAKAPYCDFWRSIFGWHNQLLATPRLDRSGTLSYSAGLWERVFGPQPQGVEVGQLTYTDGNVAGVMVPAAGGVEYNVSFSPQQHVNGINISSHRPIGNYQQIGNIPTQPLGADQAYTLYSNEIRSRYQNSYTQFSPTYRMKEAIISMAMFGPGNSYVQENPKILKLFMGFKDILANILPPSIGFKDISIRIPDVILVTDTGEFVIDASSGGVMALIDLAWQIFLYSQDKDHFVVILDEPENHLHPTMQRSILLSLITSFPSAQFIVATHSPFVVSSVKESHVYVLRHMDEEVIGAPPLRRVHTLRLDNANKAGTASEILRDVLGVPVTLPQWAEDDLKNIANQFVMREINSENLSLLKKKLIDAGLGEFYPDALQKVTATQ